MGSCEQAIVCGAGGGIRSHHKGSEPTTLEGQEHTQTGWLPCFLWGLGTAAYDQLSLNSDTMHIAPWDTHRLQRSSAPALFGCTDLQKTSTQFSFLGFTF